MGTEAKRRRGGEKGGEAQIATPLEQTYPGSVYGWGWGGWGGSSYPYERKSDKGATGRAPYLKVQEPPSEEKERGREVTRHEKGEKRV